MNSDRIFFLNNIKIGFKIRNKDFPFKVLLASISFMSDRDITVVSQEDLDFIEIGRSKLSYYKRLGVGIYPNDVFAEVADTFLFLKNVSRQYQKQNLIATPKRGNNLCST